MQQKAVRAHVIKRAWIGSKDVTSRRQKIFRFRGQFIKLLHGLGAEKNCQKRDVLAECSVKIYL